MADFSALKEAIQDYIKQNGNEEITGEKLQTILLSIVNTLGDSAINDLITALNAEVAARQNADGTLQQNITNEATARNNADTALGGRIDDEATARENADTALQAAINLINSYIPAQASSSNKLADKDFVNSSIATATATFRGTYNVVTDLGLSYNATNAQIQAALATKMAELSIIPDNNDYVFVQRPTSDATPSQIENTSKYKYNGSAWAFEYVLNNSGFTAAQWAAINSGATLELIGKLSALPTNAQLIELLNDKVSWMDNGAYDVTSHNSGATFASLSALLNSDNLATLIPTDIRRGGMSIKFVLTSDNKYVQARCMAQNFTADVTQWQGVDETPTIGSNNLVKSGGVDTIVHGTPILLSENGYYNLSGGVGSQLPAEPTANSRYKCVKTACNNMQLVNITSQGASAAKPYAFVDSNNNIIEVSEEESLTNAFIEVPDNAEYLVINDSSNSSSYIVGEDTISAIKRDIAQINTNLQDDSNLLNYQPISLDDGFIDCSLDTIDITYIYPRRDYKYAIIPCTYKDVFYINAVGAIAAKPWCFIDANNKRIKYSSGESTISPQLLQAPVNATYLIVNVKTDNSYFCYKLNNSPQKVLANSLPWADKVIACFGDSRTWYDGNPYNSSTKEEIRGKICIGYQQTAAKLTNARFINYGVSGESSVGICNRIRNTDFSNIDAILIEGGVNDFVISVHIGELLPIGSTFDTNTSYGAWQSAIEYLQTNYPNVRIFMTVPSIAWLNGTVYPYELACVKRKIAQLYNIPCIDLYKSMGITTVNREFFFADDTTQNNWYLHFNNFGNVVFGNIIGAFLNANYSNMASVEDL